MSRALYLGDQVKSRERITLALNHQEPDGLPVDLGTALSGIAASTVYRLRQALELDPPGRPARVVEPFQMLGEVKPDLLEAVRESAGRPVA